MNKELLLHLSECKKKILKNEEMGYKDFPKGDE